jgi:hypothetical protein
MVLTLITRSHRCPGLLATVAGGIASADLIPASRDQDHTPWPSASRAVRYRRIRVHRIPSRVRDDREPPLGWDGMAESIMLILPRRQAKFPKFRNLLKCRFPSWPGWPAFARASRITPLFHAPPPLRRNPPRCRRLPIIGRCEELHMIANPLVLEIQPVPTASGP